MTRRVLITGASSGIGAATARRLAAPGVALVIHARSNEAGAVSVAKEARAKGAEAHVVLADLSDPEAPAGLVEAAAERLGGLDAVVSNAGFADRTPASDLSDAALARSLDTILWAFLRLARAAGPHLRRGTQGRLVAVSSFVAHLYRHDAHNFPATAVGKLGVEALLRTLAMEWAPEVTVNAVAPGYTQKDPGAHAAYSEEQRQALVAKVPMRRLGTPEEMAAAITFLLGEEAGYVTGQVIHVNGGLVV
ncbi:SDR family NAD(P)-dependent oxidoreductase [Sabulicella glaciei]|uniref:SDR family oxidoreductase n=1 Tax=Sabulicella glaciei TaxID=2984948 RepID=A0ABT3NX36_9PROT|nr:SDR family oxidoreductase [Roseococcus sp. MDT2-1-1]